MRKGWGLMGYVLERRDDRFYPNPTQLKPSIPRTLSVHHPSSASFSISIRKTSHNRLFEPAILQQLHSISVPALALAQNCLISDAVPKNLQDVFEDVERCFEGFYDHRSLFWKLWYRWCWLRHNALSLLPYPRSILLHLEGQKISPSQPFSHTY